MEVQKIYRCLFCGEVTYEITGGCGNCGQSISSPQAGFDPVCVFRKSVARWLPERVAKEIWKFSLLPYLPNLEEGLENSPFVARGFDEEGFPNFYGGCRPEEGHRIFEKRVAVGENLCLNVERVEGRGTFVSLHGHNPHPDYPMMEDGGCAQCCGWGCWDCNGTGGY